MEDPLEQEMATCLLQYSCLRNAMVRGAWQAAVHGVAKEIRLSTARAPCSMETIGQSKALKGA